MPDQANGKTATAVVATRKGSRAEIVASDHRIDDLVSIYDRMHSGLQDAGVMKELPGQKGLSAAAIKYCRDQIESAEKNCTCSAKKLKLCATCQRVRSILRIWQGTESQRVKRAAIEQRIFTSLLEAIDGRLNQSEANLDTVSLIRAYQEKRLADQP